MKKTCSKCNIDKSISEFNKVKTGKYGVRGDCRECYKKYMKKHYLKQYQNNKKYKEEKKEYYNNNKQNYKNRYEIYRIMRKNN